MGTPSPCSRDLAVPERPPAFLVWISHCIAGAWWIPKTIEGNSYTELDLPSVIVTARELETKHTRPKLTIRDPNLTSRPPPPVSPLERGQNVETPAGADPSMACVGAMGPVSSWAGASTVEARFALSGYESAASSAGSPSHGGVLPHDLQRGLGISERTGHSMRKSSDGGKISPRLHHSSGTRAGSDFG